MNALAGYVMKGPWQGALVASGFLLLGVLFFPFLWLSAAALGLVWLRGDARTQWMTTGAALLGAAGFSALVLGSLSYLILTLVFWLPVVLLALVLRKTVSLALCVLLAGGLGVLVVLAAYALLGDPAEHWRQMLGQLFTPEWQAQLAISDEAWHKLLDTLAMVMTGNMAVWLVITTLLGLFIARRWQAQLYNPGGFQREFHELRLGQSASLVLALLVLGGLSAQPLLSNLAWVAGIIALIQGLAVIHAVVKLKQRSVLWLFMTYFLLTFPLTVFYTALLLIVIGVADAWFDFRARVAQQTAN